MSESFTEYDSGYSILAAAYYNLEKLSFTDTTYLHTSIVHSDANNKASNLNTFQNGISSALIMTKDSASLVSEVTAGIESENGTASQSTA